MTTTSSFTRLPEKEQFTAFKRGQGDSLIDDMGNPDYAAIRQTPEFNQVRRRLAWFAFPMSALFFCWYMTYVLLGAYARDFMSQPVFGSVNVGLLLGLSQFVLTVVIMLLYMGFARRKIDPHTAALRERAGAGRS